MNFEFMLGRVSLVAGTEQEGYDAYRPGRKPQAHIDPVCDKLELPMLAFYSSPAAGTAQLR